MFKKVIYNTGSQIFGKAVSAVITFLITIIIANSLNASGFGDFTKAFVFVGYFYILADFGLNTIFIRENQKFENLVAARIILALTSAIIAVIISIFLPFNSQTGIGFSSQVKFAILLASMTIFTQTILTTANAFFQRKLRYDLSTISVIIGYFVILSSALIVAINPSLFGFISAYVLGGATFSIASLLLIARIFKQRVKPNFDLAILKRMLIASAPVGFALLANLIYFRADVFILSSARSSQEVGVYGLAYQFFEAALAIPLFFTNSLYPLLAGSYKNDRARYQKEYLSWLRILTAIGVLLTILLISASFLMPIFFSNGFSGSPKALIVLALGLPFFFISALFWHLIIIEGKEKYLTHIYVLGAIINVLANIIFIPRFGYMAAAIITVLSEAFITVLLFLLLKFKKTNA